MDPSTLGARTYSKSPAEAGKTTKANACARAGRPSTMRRTRRARPLHLQATSPMTKCSAPLRSSNSPLDQEAQQRATALLTVARATRRNEVVSTTAAPATRHDVVAGDRRPGQDDPAVGTQRPYPPNVVLVLDDEDSVEPASEHIVHRRRLVLRDQPEPGEPADARLLQQSTSPQVASEVVLGIPVRASMQGVVLGLQLFMNAHALLLWVARTLAASERHRSNRELETPPAMPRAIATWTEGQTQPRVQSGSQRGSGEPLRGLLRHRTKPSPGVARRHPRDVVMQGNPDTVKLREHVSLAETGR